MTTTGSVGGDQVLLERGPLRVELVLHPFSLTVSRAGRRLLRSCGLWVADGVVHDHFVQFTEGVLAAEELSPTERGVRAEVAASGPDWIVLAVKLEGGREATLRVTVGDDRRIALELHADGEPLRPRSTGTGALRSGSSASGPATARSLTRRASGSRPGRARW